MANYYNVINLEKFHSALEQAKQDVRDGKVTAVSISKSNVKMGNVSSVSTLPFITCPGICKDTCGPDCYAAKLAILRGSVLTSYARNTALLMLNPAAYWSGIDAACKASRFFRFHVSGDILNAAYFDKMVETARNNPETRILAFTKRYGIVNSWIAKNGALPSNLHILFSGWTNLKPVNPYNLPETIVYNKNETPAESWLLCGGNCFNCACRGLGCWKAESGDVIAFKKH